MSAPKWSPKRSPASGRLARSRSITAWAVLIPWRLKFRGVVVTHAEFPSQNMTAGEQVEVANLGAMIEHCFTTMYTNKAPWPAYFDSVRKVGPERVVLSTDLGQTINPPVAEGFAMFAQKMLDADFSAADVRRMCVTNPTALVS